MTLKKNTRRSMALVAAMGSAMLFSATGAYAGYTAIDESPTGTPITLNFGGYCDSQSTVGAECDSPYTLPYTVGFAGGSTDKLLLRDDGVLDFVGDLLPSPPDATHLFNVLASVDTGVPGSGFPPQLATLTFQGPSILATWFTCASPVSSCYVDQHTALLTPGNGGFTIAYSGIAGQNSPPSFLEATFDPAQGSVTPEPAAWALLVLGFGAAGAMLRRRGLRFA
ncbi:MAG: PEPxxWA-CTERM sorting domain-containing protein [Caulobacterales bacterium]|jgi:hypothetical protein